MSAPALDPVIHPPKRLAVVAFLSRALDADFRLLRDHAKISDSDLSKQMSALQEAGYVSVRKTGRGPGHSTTYALTRSGRAAFTRHVAALRAIVGEEGATPAPAGHRVGTP